MVILLMASPLRDELPSIFFEQPNQLAKLHAPIVRGSRLGRASKSQVTASGEPPTSISRFAQYSVRPTRGCAGDGRTEAAEPRQTIGRSDGALHGASVASTAIGDVVAPYGFPYLTVGSWQSRRPVALSCPVMLH